jgi:CHASE3 domain sensor protein
MFMIYVSLTFEYNSISELKKLLDCNCKLESIQPPVIASDAETNIVIVTIVCPDGKKHTIKAFRDESRALREFIRSHT